MNPEELELRTMRNIHLKYIKMINYELDHKDISDDYDGYKASRIFDKLSSLLRDHDIEVSKTKFKKQHAST